MSVSPDRVLMKLALRQLEYGLKDKCADILQLAKSADCSGPYMVLIEGLHAYSCNDLDKSLELLDRAQEQGDITPDMQKSFLWVRSKVVYKLRKKQEESSAVVSTFAERVRRFEQSSLSVADSIDNKEA